MRVCVCVCRDDNDERRGHEDRLSGSAILDARESPGRGPGAKTTAATFSRCAPTRRAVNAKYVAPGAYRLLLTLALGLFIAALSVRHRPTNAQSNTNRRPRSCRPATYTDDRDETQSAAQRFFFPSHSPSPPRRWPTDFCRADRVRARARTHALHPPARRISCCRLPTHSPPPTGSLNVSCRSAEEISSPANDQLLLLLLLLRRRYSARVRSPDARAQTRCGPFAPSVRRRSLRPLYEIGPVFSVPARFTEEGRRKTFC